MAGRMKVVFGVAGYTVISGRVDAVVSLEGRVALAIAGLDVGAGRGLLAGHAVTNDDLEPPYGM